jgi:hypothetical protein
MTSAYEMHKANHNRVAASLKQVERAANAALRRNDLPSVGSMTSTQMMLVAIKAESRLQKMMHTPGWLDAGGNLSTSRRRPHVTTHGSDSLKQGSAFATRSAHASARLESSSTMIQRRVTSRCAGFWTTI